MAILLRRTPSAVAFAPHLVKLVDPLLKGPKRRQLHSARELTSTPAAPPVVLTHGFLGFDELSLGPLRLSYYGSIASLLRAFGFSRILTPVVPPTGSVSLRAESLQAAIHKFEGRKPCERVIVIGHSMGGLDARHLCSRLGGDSLVSAVITVATPHKGSQLGDLIMGSAEAVGFDQLLERLTRKQQSTISQFLHRLPASGRCLTTAGAAEFNACTPDSKDVAYYSIGGSRGSTRRTTPSLKLPHWYLDRLEGPNDGMVSVASARWGVDLGVMDLDHRQQIDLLGQRRPLLERHQFDLLTSWRPVLQVLDSRRSERSR